MRDFLPIICSGREPKERTDHASTRCLHPDGYGPARSILGGWPSPEDQPELSNDSGLHEYARRLRLRVFAPKTLMLAWTKIRANKGAAGVDGQSIGRFAAKAELYLSELSAALRDGSYQPQAVKRVDIPKGDGKTRPLGIPTVKDRIVQQAVRLVIEPIFESGFAEGSFGFRPGRGCHDALRPKAKPPSAACRPADQGGVHACRGRRLGRLFRLDSA